MTDDTGEDRLTILERAQLLHDATLRRHGDMLDKHAEQLALLRDLLTRQTKTQQDLATTQAQLAETLDAIKDMLGRGNGH